MNLPEDQKTDIQQRIAENSKRITRLVDGMLDLSDLNSETIVERHDRTDVLELVTQAIDGSKITLNTRPVQSDSAILFETDINETVSAMTLLTNKRYVIRILVQLLENAMKFTKEGRIVLRVEATDDTILFSVEDTGIGIPADQTENIFGEFVQLDSFVDGTGIGLTIGRSIARRMGGDLWLDTNYTQGARFVLKLLKE
jgi:signal transduction histidine kinase